MSENELQRKADEAQSAKAAEAKRERIRDAAPDMLKALEALLDRYVQLVNCGDCGNWNPEDEDEVKAARAAFAKAEGSAR